MKANYNNRYAPKAKKLTRAEERRLYETVKQKMLSGTGLLLDYDFNESMDSYFEAGQDLRRMGVI